MGKEVESASNSNLRVVDIAEVVNVLSQKSAEEITVAVVTRFCKGRILENSCRVYVPSKKYADISTNMSELVDRFEPKDLMEE